MARYKERLVKGIACGRCVCNVRKSYMQITPRSRASGREDIYCIGCGETTLDAAVNARAL